MLEQSEPKDSKGERRTMAQKQQGDTAAHTPAHRRPRSRAVAEQNAPLL